MFYIYAGFGFVKLGVELITKLSEVLPIPIQPKSVGVEREGNL